MAKFLVADKPVRLVQVESPLVDTDVSGNTQVIISDCPSFEEACTESEKSITSSPRSTSVTEVRNVGCSLVLSVHITLY